MRRKLVRGDPLSDGLGEGGERVERGVASPPSDGDLGREGDALERDGDVCREDCVRSADERVDPSDESSDFSLFDCNDSYNSSTATVPLGSGGMSIVSNAG